GSAPIGAFGARVRISEVSAADRDVVRRGGKATHGNAGRRGNLIRVRAGCALVARGHENRHALAYCLLVSRVESSVLCRSIYGFRLAITHADDSGPGGVSARSVEEIL